MTFLISVLKTIALVFWSLFAAVLTAPYLFTGGWKGVKKISRVTMLWNRGIARIINLRVKVYGDVPGGEGGLVVSNHMSYLDIIALGSVLPLRYSPKSEISKWPFLGWYVGLSRPIWIDRASNQSSKKALEDYTETIEHGMYPIVYPEGTTTDGKSGILPFKSTSFEAAINGNVPVIPVLIGYKQPSNEPTVAWYGDMTLLPHVWQVLQFPSIAVELRFLSPIFHEGRSRKELAAFTHAALSREYSQTVSRS
ncbi:MAG: 1-acyl-sn-glycerol-3-phosphate acyltransferase [Candidatus Omnitrophica bacterium]|nr:1-acyl-sn-glycerol-3-phosphate acyltransferase [Candidatus Omnitrophota bacterium]